MSGMSPRAAAEPAPIDRAPSSRHLAGAAVSAGLALAWLVLSWLHPAVTYHFGPPLAAAAWPTLLRPGQSGPAQRRRALIAAVGGFLIAMAALGMAVAAHWLRGPTLIGSGGVPAEEALLAAAAAAWGWRVAARARRTRLLPLSHRSDRGGKPS